MGGTEASIVWAGGIANYHPPAKVRALNGFMWTEGHTLRWRTTGSLFTKPVQGQVAGRFIQRVLIDRDGSVLIGWRRAGMEEHLRYWSDLVTPGMGPGEVFRALTAWWADIQATSSDEPTPPPDERTPAPEPTLEVASREPSGKARGMTDTARGILVICALAVVGAIYLWHRQSSGPSAEVRQVRDLVRAKIEVTTDCTALRSSADYLAYTIVNGGYNGDDRDVLEDLLVRTNRQEVIVGC
jgi:hypothetical protein